MEDDFRKSTFYRAFMTAVFVGIITTLLTLFYDLVFVDLFKFPLSAIINVSSLIFSVNLLFLCVGFLYYGFIRLFKRGDVIFILLFSLLTAFFIWKAEGAHRTDDVAVNTQFRNLLAGIILIVGIASSFVVPFLFHNRKFEEYVL